jgi:tetratricopeptide (TPR) repeat protein
MKTPVVIFNPKAAAAVKALRRRRPKLLYKKYHRELSALRDKFSYEPYLHTWFAAVHGDFGQMISARAEKRMKAEAVEILRGVSFSPMMKIPKFNGYVRNELYYHSGDFLAQYKLGLEKNRQVRDWGWFSIGVGASEHAWKLFERGKHREASKFARKAVEAWQFYENPADYGGCFYLSALAISGSWEDAATRFTQMIKSDSKRADIKRWYSKYRARLARIRRFYEALNT